MSFFLNRLLTVAVGICILIHASLGMAWLAESEEAIDSVTQQQQISHTEGILKQQQARAKEREIKHNFAKKLEAYWSKPVFSDAQHWVSYSSDFSVLRIVDYENNEFNFTLPYYEKDGQTDFILAKEVASDQLVELLSTTIGDAIRQDPFKEIWEEGASIDAIFNSAVADELVFSELFPEKKPSKRSVQKVAAQLIEKSHISYNGRSQQHTLKNNASSKLSGMPVSGTTHKINLKVPLPSNRLMKKAEEYLPSVSRYSKLYTVSTNMVFAIMHTESHFNPLARSHIPAFGLMQIVPSTAGKDVSKFLFKNKKQVTSSFLLEPENNIQVGVGYLNLLYYRYLKKIEDPQSRLYCMIAAYNAGTANVARAFVRRPSMRKAAPVINQMASDQVLRRLMEKLPAKETRDYVQKVLGRAPHYIHFEQLALSN